MNCDRAQAAISSRMDGQHLTPRVADAVDAHLASCAACSTFRTRAQRLRTAVRIHSVEPVPDLVGPIMTAVTTIAPARTREPTPELLPLQRIATGRPRRRDPRRLAPVAAALVVGLVAGSLVVGGPWQHPSTAPIAAADVSRGIAVSAERLDAYEARFTITERNLAPDVPERELDLHVSFRAPERFRMDVVDHTAYTDGSRPTDLSLVVDGPRWSLTAPSACPSDLPLSCPPTRTLVRDRAPFSSSTPLPTDLVLPIRTLVGSPRFTVLGRTTVLGRNAVRVELPFRRTTPLFPFVDLGGRWRPFFGSDQVVLWLEEGTWFPLRWEVFPSEDPGRAAWEQRFGLPQEASDSPVFRVAARSFDPSPGVAAPGTFEIRGKTVETESARRIGFGLAAGKLGASIAPSSIAGASIAGLDPYRAVVAPDPSGRMPRRTLAFASGLAWLKVSERPGDGGVSSPLGFGLAAQEVVLPGGGVGYFEPASGSLGRRLSIVADGFELSLETNLSRDALLAAAEDLPVQGRRVPRLALPSKDTGARVERVGLPRAAQLLPPGAVLPSADDLPPGYEVASAERTTLGGISGLSIFFRQTATDLAGQPIRFHVESAATLPPPSSAAQVSLRVGDALGRWTPTRHQLEWLDGDVYFSLDSDDSGLDQLLAIAGRVEAASDLGTT